MNKIKFYPFSENTMAFAPAPIPSAKLLPEWYKKQPGIVKNENALPNGVINSTVKKCMPVFDLISAGYMIVAPCDIYVDATDPEKLSYSLPLTMKQFQSDMFATHAPEQYDHYPIDASRYHKQLLRIMPFWSIETPKGYSTLFAHPFHREDSEIYAMSAIVDTDRFISDGHFSFLVKKGFKGVIKQGTPLAQIIPFKRDDWESEEVSPEEATKKISKQRLFIRSTFANGYKDKLRSKKRVQMSDPLKISFTPAFKNHGPYLSPPEPAVRHVPEWYRGLAKFDKSNDDVTLDPVNNLGTDGAQVSTKMCMPFFDATTAGYQYVLEDDLHVDIDEEGRPVLWWEGDVMLVDKRPIIDIVVPDNCHPIHYGWRMNWYYETPPGYSVLITHPMNRYDLPFYVQSGIVESDIWGLPVFIAFFLKRNFRGVIPKGTPIMQMIPFKRDNWEMEVLDSEEDIEKHEFKAENRRSMLYGYYKKTAWRKKLFGMAGKKMKDVNHDDED